MNTSPWRLGPERIDKDGAAANVDGTLTKPYYWPREDNHHLLHTEARDHRCLDAVWSSWDIKLKG